MKLWYRVYVTLMVMFMFCLTTQATEYTVGKNGTYGYTSIDAAYEAALLNNSGSHTVVIMDSGEYDEVVEKNYGGTSGASVTVRPNIGETPSVYAVAIFSTHSDITFEGLIIDGGIRDYTIGAPAIASLVVLRAGTANYTLKNCTIKGRGITQSVYTYSGAANKTWTFDGNILEADSSGVDTMGFYYGEANTAGSPLVIKNNTIVNSSSYSWFSRAMTPSSGTVMFDHNIFDGCKRGIYSRKAVGGITNLTIVHNTFNKIAGGDLFTGGAIDMRDENDGNFGPIIRDNLFVGTGGTDYDGLNSGRTAIFDVNADYNGFYNMNVSGIANLSNAWLTVSNLNAYASSGNNVTNDIDPFVFAVNKNYHLVVGSWAATAASDGGCIGALGTQAAYTLTVDKGTGDGVYPKDTVINLVADAPSSGEVFNSWTGDVSNVENVNLASTSITMPSSDVSIGAYYIPAVTYTLTVNNGTGDGNYTYGTAVAINADAPASSQLFSIWTGDTAGIANIYSPSTTFTMPSGNQVITATYVDKPTNVLTVNGGIGSGSYWEGQEVTISAVPAMYKGFDSWIGNTSYLNDPALTTTIVTMPNMDQTVTATFIDLFVYEVSASGGYTYTTVSNAYIAASASDSGGIVRIMDSAVYNEIVTYGSHISGDINDTIIVESAEKQTPVIYAMYLPNKNRHIISGIKFDGTLRDWTSAVSGRYSYTFHMRYKGDYTITNCTFAGRGQYGMVSVMGDFGSVRKITDCTFDGDGDGASAMITYANGISDGACDVIVEHCEFYGDQAYRSSALYWRDYNSTDGSVLFNYNLCISNGPAVLYLGANDSGSDAPIALTVDNCTFYKCGGGAPRESGAMVIREIASDDFGTTVTDCLIVGHGTNDNHCFGLNSYGYIPSDMKTSYNGFYNMYETNDVQVVAHLYAEKTVAELNAYVSSSNNIVGDVNPFRDPGNGDFSLRDVSWAVTAGSDGGYIGALPVLPPSGFLMIFK